MGKKTPKQPKAPNLQQEAFRQEQENRRTSHENMRMNQFRQKTPYGEVYYTGDIGTDQRTKHTVLDPALKKQLDQQMNVNTQMSDKASQLLNQMPQPHMSTDHLPGLNTDFAGEAAKVERAHFDRAASLLKPMMTDQRRTLDVELASRGIPVGSEAYHKAMGDMQRQQEDTLSRVAMSAVEAGRNEHSRQFDMSRMSRQQLMNEQLQMRQQPLAELQTYLGNQSIAMPEPHFDQSQSYGRDGVNYSQLSRQSSSSNNAAELERIKQKTMQMRGLLGLGRMFFGG